MPVAKVDAISISTHGLHPCDAYRFCLCNRKHGQLIGRRRRSGTLLSARRTGTTRTQIQRTVRVRDAVAPLDLEAVVRQVLKRRGDGAFYLPLNPVLFHFAIKRCTTNAQQLRRFGNAAAGSFKRFGDELALPVVEAQRVEIVAATGVVQGKVTGANLGAIGHHDGTVHHVTQLPHIAGPRVGNQLLAGSVT